MEGEPTDLLKEATSAESSTSSLDPAVEVGGAAPHFLSSSVSSFSAFQHPSSSPPFVAATRSIAGESRVAGFEIIPTSSSSNSDLLSRIGSFLPKIRAANEELLRDEAVALNDDVDEATKENEEGLRGDHDSRRSVTNRNDGTRKRKLQDRRIDVYLESDNDASSTSSSSSSSSVQSTTPSSSSSSSSDDSEAGDADRDHRKQGGVDKDSPPARNFSSSAGRSRRRTSQKRNDSDTTGGSDGDGGAIGTTTPGPMIEIQLALGPVEDNPIINWLAPDQEIGAASGEEAMSSHHHDVGVVERLLRAEPNQSVNRTTAKGPLITEL